MAAPAAGAAAGFDIQPAAPADAAELGALYAQAFSDNPAYATIFLHPPGSAAAEAALAWLFTRRVRALLATGNTVLLAREQGGGGGGAPRRILAAVGLVAPDREPTIPQLLWHGGMAAWPCAHGLPSLLRALEVAKLDEPLTALPPPAPAPPPPPPPPHTLVMMAVHPAAQRRGVGGALLSALLRAHDASSGARIVLATQREGNTAFYARAGFETVGTREIAWAPGDPRRAFTSWYMLRPSAATAAAAAT